MTDIDGYTNHLLNVLNGVLRQAGYADYNLSVTFTMEGGGDERKQFGSIEDLRQFLDSLADRRAREEARRRVGGNSPYEPLVEREYDRIMERANK